MGQNFSSRKKRNLPHTNSTFPNPDLPSKPKTNPMLSMVVRHKTPQHTTKKFYSQTK